VECDGASYHSSPTARDRDRLRQEHLERLGWRFHRIWSTEWFTNRPVALQRVKAAYEAALRAHDAPTTPPERKDPEVEAPVHAPDPDPGPQVPTRKGPRPAVRRGLPIDGYTTYDLVRMISWIESDTLLRTDFDLVAEVMKELGFQRQGSRIVGAISAAIQIAHAQPGRSRPASTNPVAGSQLSPGPRGPTLPPTLPPPPPFGLPKGPADGGRLN